MLVRPKITLEKHFEKLLQDEFTAAHAHVVRLPDDLKVALAQGQPKALGKKKPYDFGVCFQGHYMAVECKIVKGLIFLSEQVAQHQWEGLMEARDAGATPLLAIYFKHKQVLSKRDAERREIITESWVLINLNGLDIQLDKPDKFQFSWDVESIAKISEYAYVQTMQNPGSSRDFEHWLDVMEGS